MYHQGSCNRQGYKQESDTFYRTWSHQVDTHLPNTLHGDWRSNNGQASSNTGSQHSSRIRALYEYVLSSFGFDNVPRDDMLSCHCKADTCLSHT